MSCSTCSGVPSAATGSASRASAQSQSGVRSTAAKPSRAHASTLRGAASEPRACSARARIASHTGSAG